MTTEELAAHPSYPELLAADGHNLLGRLAALEQRSVKLEHTCAVQQEAIDALLDVTDTLAGRVNDLTAQLAQHEAAPYPHVRYDLQAIGEIVLCGLDTPDYAIGAQTDAPDAFERLSAADSAPANELPVRVYGADPTKELPTFRQYAPDSAAGGA